MPVVLQIELPDLSNKKHGMPVEFIFWLNHKYYFLVCVYLMQYIWHSGFYLAALTIKALIIGQHWNHRPQKIDWNL